MPRAKWNTYEVRLTLDRQPHFGDNLGPEFNGDGTAFVHKTIRATSRANALYAAKRYASNVIEAEILEEDTL